MAVGTYTHSTLQDLVDQLAQDLGDAGKKFFTSTELERSVVEALRLSNALTARERGTIQFTTTAGVAWYDLEALGAAYLSKTYTDRTAIENMQYRLMERVDATAGSTMTEMFAFSEFLRTLQQSRDRVLAETECVVTRRPAQSNITTAGRVDVDESIIRTLRVIWNDELGRRTVLHNPTDEGTMTAKAPNRRLSRGIPRRWSLVASPQLEMQLDPIPELHPGLQSLELTTIQTGATLDTTANSNTGISLGLPDDLATGASWDAIELLLSKHGMAADQPRARFASGLGTLMRAIGESLPTVLTVTINGRDVPIGNIAFLDAKDAGWEGATRGIPRRVVGMGDWLGIYPVPDDSFSVEVVVNAKLPTLALTDYVQISREHLSGILAWAKQLVMFKVGGNPLERAAVLAGLMLDQARSFNEARLTSCQYLREFLSQGQSGLANLLRSAPDADLSGDPQDEASSRNKRQRDPQYSPYLRPIGGR